MNHMHDTIKNKKIIGRHMYNRFRNIKKAGLVLIGLAIVVFIIANVRIRSVDSYRKQFNNVADSGQTQADNPDNTRKDLKQNPSGKGADNNSGKDSNGNENVVNGNEAAAGGSESDADGGKNNMNDTENDANDSKSDPDSNSDANGGTGDNTGNSGGNNSGSNNSDSSNSGSNDNSQNTQPSGRLITCTIEIRCDNATAKKDTITNPGIRDAIPDDGTILEVTTYTGNEGFTVYDVLAAVTAMHDPVIPIVANSDKSYVSSINNLSEKNVGPTSGWTYRVNGVLPMMAANQYKVKDGDVIKWIYVCQWGDK